MPRRRIALVEGPIQNVSVYYDPRLAGVPTGAQLEPDSGRDRTHRRQDRRDADRAGDGRLACRGLTQPLPLYGGDASAPCTATRSEQ